MSVLTRWAAIGSVAILGFMARPSAAAPVLSNWGVTLSTQNTTDPGTGYTINSISGTYNYLTINPNGNPADTYVIGSGSGLPVTGTNPFDVDYAVKATPLDELNGGGFCQVDAVFATFKGTGANATAYFAVVTNSNPNGTSWDGYTPARFGPGDLSLTVANGPMTTQFGIGARPINLDTPGYGAINYGTTDTRNPASWGNAYTPSLTNYTSFATTSADVVAGPTWSHVDNEGGDESNMTQNAYFIANTGTSVGSATATWQQLVIGGNPYVGYDQAESQYGDANMQPYSTWVYEVAVPFSDLGLSYGDAFRVVFAPDCGNDSLALTGIVLPGTVTSPGPVVPEPISMIFFGTGLVAVGGYVTRRKMLAKA